MRLLLRWGVEVCPFSRGGQRPRYSVAPYELRADDLRVDLNHTQGIYVLAFFCHRTVSEMDLVEIRWPDPDTMPDQWRNCLGSETSQLNKLLARVGARIIRRQGYYRMLEPEALEMAA